MSTGPSCTGNTVKCYGDLDSEARILLLGKKKEHQLKLSGPDVFWWGGGLPREAGKKKPYTTLSSEELFFAKRYGGHRGKISVVGMVPWFS